MHRVQNLSFNSSCACLFQPLNAGRTFSRELVPGRERGDDGFDFTPKYVWQSAGQGGGGGGRQVTHTQQNMTLLKHSVYEPFEYTL